MKHRQTRTLAGDVANARQLVHFHLVQLLWRLARSERFLELLAAVAIAGLFLGLLIGWWT